MFMFGSIFATIITCIVCALLAVIFIAAIMREFPDNKIVGYKLRIISAWALMFMSFLTIAIIVSLIQLLPHVSPM